MQCTRNIFRNVRLHDIAFGQIWCVRNSSSRLHRLPISGARLGSRFDQIEKDTDEIMPHASFKNIKIYYETYGSGTPLLLVPGLGGVGSYWAPQIDFFARHFNVIVHDHRGTGLSTHDPITYSVEQMADDLIGLMDSLGIERAHLVGHRTGGAIGQVLALDHPERLVCAVLSATGTKAD